MRWPKWRKRRNSAGPPGGQAKFLPNGALPPPALCAYEKAVKGLADTIVTARAAAAALAFIAAFVFIWDASTGMAAGQEAAAPLRVAVVDLVAVFERHPEAESALAALTEERDAARELFREKSKALKETLQKHQELIQAGEREDAKEVLKEAGELETAIATLKTTQEQEIEKRFLAERRRILESIKETVAELNANGRYHLVLDRSAAAANGLPMVLDVRGLDDLTESVLQRVTEKAKEAGKKAQPAGKRP